MGHVRVEPGSGMIGRVVCGMLSIAGRYDGDATVFGEAILAEEGDCRGVVRARSLMVPEGTCFVGRAHIGAMLEDDPATYGEVESEPANRVMTRAVVPTRLRRRGVLKVAG